ncbi:hypothetical protein [Maribacter sp. 2308TA10-17]|uniref:hypothetical protein n=1 Tax=Maribacter sp. 2308TA10-17 TaxID=3386276 RepID=UPI0039BC37EE
MEYLEIVNSVVLAILVALFFMQNKVLNSVKTFFEIFDIEKVKQYVKMNEETVLGKAANLVADDEKMRDIMHEVTSSKFEEMSKFYAKIMGERLVQSAVVNYKFIKGTIAEEDWERFVDEQLPESKEFLMKMLYPEDSDNTNS